MAEGLSVQARYDLNTTQTKERFQAFQTAVLSGTDYTHAKQTIGTSEEALVVGDVSGKYSLLLQNHDPTNFIEIRPGSGLADLIQVGPGQFTWIPAVAASATVFCIADTAGCLVEYWAVDP